MQEKKYQVLWICTWFPTRVQPCAGNFILRHLSCVQDFAEVDVLHIQFDPRLPFFALDRTQTLTHGCPTHVVYFGAHRYNKWIQILRAYLSGFRALWRSRRKYHLIHAHVMIHAGLFGGLFSRWVGKPLIISEHAGWFLPQNPRRISLPYLWLARWIALQAHLVMPVSQALLRAMQSRGIEGNYQVVPNAVDPGIFHPKHQPESRLFTFLHVSNFNPAAKNISGMLRAFAPLLGDRDDVQLVIAGDGPLDEVKRAIEYHALPSAQVRLLGPLAEVQVASLMQRAHALVQFSNYETFGCVVVEAWACGLPVISTNVGGLRDLPATIRVKAGDVQELRAALERMVHVREARPPVDPARIAPFTVGAVSEQLRSVYQMVSAQ